MTIKLSRKWWLSIGVTVGLVALVWAVSTALAQEPGGDTVTSPAALYSQTWTFTYQGRLSEGGAPANGAYDFATSVYTHPTTSGSLVATCIDVGPGLSNYQVTDGLFTFHLLCNGDNSAVFTGGDRWLEVQVAQHGTGVTTTLARQAIAPAPYAFSLFPGAIIISDTGTSSGFGNAILNIDNSRALSGGGDTSSLYVRASTGSAVRAESGGIGVYGSSTWTWGVHGESTNGTAGHFVSSTGYGVYAQSDGKYAGYFVNTGAGGGLYVQSSETSGPIFEAGSPGDLEFYVDGNGDVYADRAYHCGNDISDSAGDLSEAEIAPCLVDSTPADFAEVLPAADDPEPGDVLAIAPDGTLVRSSEPYQTSVGGVYSTRPSYIGGAANLGVEGYAPLAIVGVVPVKASAENGPIQPGDLLTASSTPGHAMRADHFVGGAIIGKALQPLEEGTGVIQMLVMLQ